jgi:hypothetical protein
MLRLEAREDHWRGIANAVADVYRPKLESSPAPSQRRRSLFRRVWDALRQRRSGHPQRGS